ELWYEYNVWVPLLDKIYGDIPGVQCVRGEVINLATKRRKFDYGTGDKAVKNNFIVRTVGNGHLLEFVCGETACSHHDGRDGKHVYESSLKVPKSLRDMFLDLCRSADWDTNAVKKLEGIVARMGTRSDMIIQKVSNGVPLEYGVGEDGPLYDGHLGRKKVHEAELKLPKTMKDMMTILCNEYDWNKMIMKDIEVVGYCHSGKFVKIFEN
ncbi:hypothetical protein BCR42DRAFT_338871, partial [Absidia repens]